MKRGIALLLIVIAFLIVDAPDCAAAAQESSLDAVYEQGIERFGESLPDSMRAYLEDGKLKEDGGVLDAFWGLLKELPSMTAAQLELPLTLFASVLALLLLRALIGATGIAEQSAAGSLAVNVAVSLATALAVSAALTRLIESAQTVLETANTAVVSAVPVYAGLSAAAGTLVSGSLYGLSVALVGGAASSVVTKILLPLTGILIGLGLVSGITEGLQSLCDGIKKAAVWAMGLLTSCFVGVLSLQGKVSANADAALLKTARFVASSAVPIIGSAVSEASGAVTASARLMRSTLGSAGIIVIAATLLPQILLCLLSGVSLSLCGVFADIAGLTAQRRCLLTLKASVDILTAALTFHLIALIVCVAVMIGTGG
ncbi:MAG: hypothetical protein VB092_03275 [Oscillospiraceae bacterium]|nr:hypothetical protein [Oscillospiraceae bacterium]